MIDQKLLDWYWQNARELPWRQGAGHPYETWVSEIMLQQTQVQTVIPYYKRFMEWFPTVRDLAKAPEEKLLKAWEGLGYYSRVRNMQVAAQCIVDDYDGRFPMTAKELQQLKGIGPYTAGAIASIAFNQVVPAVDGNVLRVYARLFAIADDIRKPKTVKQITECVEETMSKTHPGDFNQALMDLGSLYCTAKNWNCSSCPLKEECQAYQMKTVENYPYKSKAVKPKDHYYLALAVQNRSTQKYYIEQRPSTGLLANLWQFPLIEVSMETYQMIQRFSTTDGLRVAEEQSPFLDILPKDIIWQTQPKAEVHHVFSHQKWHILLAYGIDVGDGLDGIWIDENSRHDYAFSTVQQKLWEQLKV